MGAALFSWLESYYGDLDQIAPLAPLWPSLSFHRPTPRVDPRTGKPRAGLSLWAIAKRAEAVLGTTKVHTTRHTFAHEMEEEAPS